ncbi:MAG: hypothetical protein A2170_01360 [Deltaproteobacteria bacterium RBG_13_53_10]|nr:MAG: hypothetical protein A2170_01360 [Deltaproteobacteria bacterium RBG_13_53_10]
MGTRVFANRWFSTIVHYLTLAWTIFCIIGAWFIILRDGIILKGLFAVFLTFFFAAFIWAIPFAALIVLSLFVAPPEKASRSVPFKELIKKGMRRRF